VKFVGTIIVNFKYSQLYLGEAFGSDLAKVSPVPQRQHDHVRRFEEKLSHESGQRAQNQVNVYHTHKQVNHIESMFVSLFKTV
jgi:hypothetical protein